MGGSIIRKKCTQEHFIAFVRKQLELNTVSFLKTCKPLGKSSFPSNHTRLFILYMYIHIYSHAYTHACVLLLSGHFYFH